MDSDLEEAGNERKMAIDMGRKQEETSNSAGLEGIGGLGSAAI